MRLLADEHMSHRFIDACMRLETSFPITHISEWQEGRYRNAKDPVLLGAIREQSIIILGFDRRTMAMHATELTRAGAGHAGVILFRRSISQMDYGKQSRTLVSFWREANAWDWSDRIEYLPRD